MDWPMKTRIIAAACSLAILLAMTGGNRDLVEYEPLKLQTGAQNKLIPAPELNTSAHLESVKVVLDFYGEQWQTNSSGKLLISRKLSNDKEHVWNYTKKAEDPKFIENVRAQKQ